MMKLKSNLINVEIEDIKETINKALETKFEKGKDSNQFYEKIYEKFMKVKENYFNLTKQETEKEIVKESEITSEEIKKINESLRKLRKKAETTIDYKHLPYEQLKDTEDIDKVTSMSIDALKHKSKKKKDGSKKLSDKEIERIMEAFKEKLISERMEDEIEENESQKDDTKNSNVKNYKSKRTTNGKKLKEGGKGDDSGDNSSSDEDDDDKIQLI